MYQSLRSLLFVGVALILMVSAASAQSESVKVFLLAGQSNMQGHGVVDLDGEKFNDGKGNLNSLLAAQPELLAHAHDGKGWVTRDDVFVRHQTRTELKTGKLTIGFTGQPGNHYIGPEFQIGHVLGQHFEEPVLLIKTAWGGKSIFRDFRPPSAGGTVGKHYKMMFEEYRAAIQNIAVDFPELADKKIELSGFVWFQGWNDMVDPAATAEYEQNIAHLINDVRNELESPNLPVVVGQLGNLGEENVNKKMMAFREAQSKGTAIGAFAGNVGFVKTAAFARPKEQSPKPREGHHWFGNAESYFLAGDAMGKEMVQLMGYQGKKRVLIVGDSISIGYGPIAMKSLRDVAWVTRPMGLNRRPENCQGTNLGISRIDEWLQIGGGQWDLIHFNFGLHDLKSVHPKTGKNSNNPNHPQQASPEAYEQQLREIVAKLKATGAKLIFATTTPVPEGVRPFRDPKSPKIYNDIALKIMAESEIEINDLYSLANDRLDEFQKPANVHFNRKGSVAFGEQVAKKIRTALAAREE